MFNIFQGDLIIFVIFFRGLKKKSEDFVETFRRPWYIRFIRSIRLMRLTRIIRSHR